MIHPTKLILFCTLLFAAMSFSTDRGGWEFLGSRKVNYRADRDEILVTRSEGVFTAVQIRVKKAPINMHKLVLHFGNGDKEEFELRNNFAAGSESRVIDLPGNKRIIRKAVFFYDTKNISERRGEVELWGKHGF
jgi:hypothetical protein